jgi:hypothetical protein
MNKLNAQEIIENNKKIIEENNLKNWQEIHNYTLDSRVNNCGACGLFIDKKEQDIDGYHLANLCDANDEIGE